MYLALVLVKPWLHFSEKLIFAQNVDKIKIPKLHIGK